jgi:hypothetical protein
MNRRKFLQYGGIALLAGCASTQEDFPLEQARSEAKSSVVNLQSCLDKYYQITPPTNQNTYLIQTANDLGEAIEQYGDLNKLDYLQSTLISGVSNLIKKDFERSQIELLSDKDHKELESRVKVNTDTFLYMLYFGKRR